jgi:hypothetical protein
LELHGFIKPRCDVSPDEYRTSPGIIAAQLGDLYLSLVSYPAITRECLWIIWQATANPEDTYPLSVLGFAMGADNTPAD